MINYKAIWDSVNEESKKNPLRPLIFRRIKSEGICNVFLATDYGQSVRLLFIHVKTGEGERINDLPKFRGLEITNVIQEIGGLKDGKFIKISQTVPNSDNIFESLIADICDKVIQVQQEKLLHSALQKVLGEWKFFFEKQDERVLSVSRQKGLAGELYFLRDYLFAKYNIADAVTYWTGADMTNHDFQLKSTAIEIKATSSKQHKKFTISSEKQLDNTGLSHLYLVLYSFALHTHLVTSNLPSLIGSISELMNDDPALLYYFHTQLAKYGYNMNYSDRYKIGFSLTGIDSFEIVDGFPRLMQKDMPEGIGDVKYSVSVAACKDFKVNKDLITLI